MTEVDASSHALFVAAASLPPEERIDLATYAVSGDAMGGRGHQVVRDAERARILRSTVMKPESAEVIGDIHATNPDISGTPFHNRTRKRVEFSRR